MACEVRELEGAKPKSITNAPLLGSSRLTLFIILLLATTNFVFQRFNINFGIVCMHQTFPNQTLGDSLLNRETTGIFDNVTSGFHESGESSSLVVMNRRGLPSAGSANETSYGSRKDDPWTSSEHIDLGDVPRCGDGRARKRMALAQQNESLDVWSEFAWSKDTQGSIIAAFYYGLTISQIPGGWFVDRFGAKSAIMLSQFSLSVLSHLNPIAARLGPEYMFVARLLQGVANGAVLPAINVLGIRNCGEMERSFLLGISYAGFGLATAVVYPISAFICENLGWEWIFHFAGGTGLLWCAIAYFLVFEWPEDNPRISKAELQFIQENRSVQYGGSKREVIGTPWVSILLSVPVWAHLIMNFSCFWCFLTISAYLPTYLTEVMNLDISDNGLLSALPFVGMMSFHFFAAAMFDWLRRKEVCSVTALRKLFNSIGMFSSASAMGILGLIGCESVIGVVLSFTLSQTFLEFALMGGYLFSIFEMAPKYASCLTSLSNTFGLLSGFISPAVVSWLTPDGTIEQWLILFYITAAINCLGALVYLVFGSCTLQQWAVDDRGDDKEEQHGQLPSHLEQ